MKLIVPTIQSPNFVLKTLIILTLVAPGCGKGSAIQRPQLNLPEKEVPDESILGRRACYNNVSPSSCFTTEAFGNLKTPGSYRYRDPLIDSSFPSSFDPEQYRAPDHLIDLEVATSGIPIAPFFVIDEFMARSKGRYGYYSASVIAKINAMRESLNRPVIINSGYRSPAYNASLPGSATWSRHTYGDAIDFKVPGWSFQAIARHCLAHGAAFYQIYTSHIHCDWRSTPHDPNFHEPSLPGSVTAADSDIYQQVTQASSVYFFEIQNFSVNKNEIELAVKTIQEDPGELIYKWNVVHSQLGEITGSSPTIVVDRKPGIYDIKVEVGGSVRLTDQLIVQ